MHKSHFLLLTLGLNYGVLWSTLSDLDLGSAQAYCLGFHFDAQQPRSYWLTDSKALSQSAVLNRNTSKMSVNSTFEKSKKLQISFRLASSYFSVFILWCLNESKLKMIKIRFSGLDFTTPIRQYDHVQGCTRSCIFNSDENELCFDRQQKISFSREKISNSVFMSQKTCSKRLIQAVSHDKGAGKGIHFNGNLPRSQGLKNLNVEASKINQPSMTIVQTVWHWTVWRYRTI